MKKQTTGQVHFGFNKCPSVGSVHFAPKPLDRGKRCPFTAAPLLTLGRASLPLTPTRGEQTATKGVHCTEEGWVPPPVWQENCSLTWDLAKLCHLETFSEQNVKLGGILP